MRNMPTKWGAQFVLRFSYSLGQTCTYVPFLLFRWQGRVTFLFPSHYSGYYPNFALFLIILPILFFLSYCHFLIGPPLWIHSITVILTLTVGAQTNVIFYCYILAIICMLFSDGPTGSTLSWDYWGNFYGGAIYIKWVRLPTPATVIMLNRCLLYFFFLRKPSLHASICKMCHAILGNMTRLLTPCTWTYPRVRDITIWALFFESPLPVPDPAAHLGIRNKLLE